MRYVHDLDCLPAAPGPEPCMCAIRRSQPHPSRGRVSMRDYVIVYEDIRTLFGLTPDGLQLLSGDAPGRVEGSRVHSDGAVYLLLGFPRHPDLEISIPIAWALPTHKADRIYRDEVRTQYNELAGRAKSAVTQFVAFAQAYDLPTDPEEMQ